MPVNAVLESRVAAERNGAARVLVSFFRQQSSACVFGIYLIGLISITKLWYPFESFPRYDFLLLAAVAMQVFMLVSHLETWREAGVIVVFHALALGLEAFKTSSAVYAWRYPEAFVVGVGGVPLFVGFMYGAVGSYITRAWRIWQFRFSAFPRRLAALPLAAAIYVNFFTHHFTFDARWVLLALSALLFGRVIVQVRLAGMEYRVPLMFGLLAVAALVWAAENIGTYCGIWLYPFQEDGWRVVPLSKLTAWFLLGLVSFVLVSIAHTPEAGGGSRGNHAS